MPHSWHSVEMRTGRRGSEVLLSTRGKVSRILGAVTDAQVDQLVWDARTGTPVPEWRQATRPGHTGLVLVDDDFRPIWFGTVIRRVPDHTEFVALSLSTLEGYLNRRYSGTMTFAQTDQSTIAAALVQATVASTGVPFVIRSTPSGILRDRTYLDNDDKTTLSLLQELMNIEQGIEFTVDLEWTDDTNTVLRFVFTVGPRVGKALPEPVRFEHPGQVVSFSVPEDYSSDNGANDVLAVSTGEAGAIDGTRPQSTRMADVPANDVRYERRFSPSTSITSAATLNAYARADLVRKKLGLTQLLLTAYLDAPGIQLNADWWLGDNLRAVITSPAYPERVGPNGQLLPGLERTVRAVGWDIDLDSRTITPRLEEV